MRIHPIKYDTQTSMAIELTELELRKLMETAQRQGELIYEPTALGVRFNLPQCLGALLK